MNERKKVERPLIRANIDPSIWIKECDSHCVHVLLTRRTHVPGKPDEPILNDWVQCFEVAEWDRLSLMKDWQANSLVFKYRIVHDPRKNG